jgi:hypothetical protein
MVEDLPVQGRPGKFNLFHSECRIQGHSLQRLLKFSESASAMLWALHHVVIGTPTLIGQKKLAGANCNHSNRVNAQEVLDKSNE